MMNKLMLVAMVFLCCFKVSAYELGFSDFGINYQLMEVDEETKTEMQVGSAAHALGLYFTFKPFKYSRTLYRHWQTTIGADLVYIKDESPFKQLVKEDNDSSVSSKESKVLGYSAYLETGISFYINGVNSPKIGLMLGYKYNDITRTIFKCSDCNTQDLYRFEHAAYLKPFITFKFFHNLDGQFYLTHYFGDSGFRNGLGLQINF